MKNKTVTRFMDMHSGGNLKTPYAHIYIEEPLEKAVETFKEIFGRDPNNVTCKCCGEDFVYEEHPSLEVASAYDRRCAFDEDKNEYDLSTCKISVDDYIKKEKVLLVVE
jgi:hypothetical protein